MNAVVAHITPGTAWQKRVFGRDADFQEATFSGLVTFKKATFSDNATFEEATFSGNAYFQEATFSGYANFQKATFSGLVTFKKAIFSDNATFEEATFSGNAYFQEATFSGRADFPEAYFGQAALFSGAPGQLTTADQQWHVAAETEKAAKTKGLITIPGGPTALAARAFSAAVFAGAIFDGDAIFDNRQMLGKFDLTDTQFLGLTSFHGVTWHPAFAMNGARFRHVVEPKKSKTLPAPSDEQLRRMWEADTEEQADDFDAWKQNWTAKRAARVAANGPTWPTKYRNLGKYNARWDAIERAYQTLKEGMEKLRRRTEEQRFYRLELLARRKRIGKDEVPWWEKAASYLYQWTSDFGGSLLRPVVAALFAYIAFATLYFASAWVIDADVRNSVRFEVGAPIHPAVEDAFDLSGELTFRPFIIWTPDLMRPDRYGDAAERNIVVDAILRKPWMPFRIGARIIGTAQSVFAIFMLFLTGLALRRRFQIN